MALGGSVWRTSLTSAVSQGPALPSLSRAPPGCASVQAGGDAKGFGIGAGQLEERRSRSIHSVNREEVDRILDKISASGLASLTPQERQFLSNFVPPDDRKPA
jgi:hypothetical protein